MQHLPSGRMQSVSSSLWPFYEGQAACLRSGISVALWYRSSPFWLIWALHVPMQCWPRASSATRAICAQNGCSTGSSRFQRNERSSVRSDALCYGSSEARSYYSSVRSLLERFLGLEVLPSRRTAVTFAFALRTVGVRSHPKMNQSSERYEMR